MLSGARPGAPPGGARTAWLLAIAAFALYWLLGQAVGLIPFYGGAGFDGAVYIEYVQKIVAGESVAGDPYRLMRVPGFWPALLAAEFGLPAAAMVAWQRMAQMLLLSIGVGLLFDLLRRIGQPAGRAALVSGGLLLAWPYALMPVYNPMLSDHQSLFCAVLALWAWGRSMRWLLMLLVFGTFWIMPGLFVVPAALLAMPYRAGVAGRGPGWSNRAAFWAVCAALALLCAYALGVAAGVPASDIDQHPPGHTLGKSTWRPLTLLLLGGALAASALMAARLLSARALWHSVAWPCAAAAFGMVALGAGSVFAGLDWAGGYQGPPLHRYLLLQGLAAPTKPLVAHFVYFGPLAVLALIGLWRRLPALLDQGLAAPLALCVAFAPLLAFASESRQWVYLLPVLAVVAAASVSTALLKLQLGFSALLLLPALALPLAARGPAEHGMLSDAWQLYFGRLGPWMGDRAYVAGIGLLLLFLLGTAWLGARRPARGAAQQ